MARPAALLACVLLMALAGGCWDRQEIENSAIAVAIGVDRADPPDRYKVTLQFAVPTHVGDGGQAGREPVATNWVVSSTGSTVFNAVRNIAHQVPRQVRLFNSRLLVIGEELARTEGIHDVIDFFDSDNEPRRRMWVLVAKDASAADVLHTFVPGSILTVDAIDNILNIAPRRTGSVVAHTLHEVSQMLSAPGWNPYVSPIEVLIEDNQAAEQLRLPQGIIPTHHPRLGGAAVFRGTHLAGWLDEREARGLQFARGKAKGGILVIACDPDGREDISIELLSATGSLLPEFKDGQLSAKIEVKATGNFVELYCEPRAHVDVLNERFAKAIEEEIRAALDALQNRFAVDALGLGLAVYQRLPEVWKQVEQDWDRVFATVPFEVDVKARLLRQGLTSSTVEVR